jgi:hypothetical protein
MSQAAKKLFGGARLAEARSAAGYKSARSFALNKKIPVSTYVMHESGDRRMDAEVAEHYAELLGVNPSWLVFESITESAPIQIVPHRVPVIGEIQPGAFVELSKPHIGSRHTHINLPPDPRFPPKEQVAFHLDEPTIGRHSYAICLKAERSEAEISKGNVIVAAIPRRGDNSLHEIVLATVRSEKGGTYQAITADRRQFPAGFGGRKRTQAIILARALSIHAPL